MKKLYIVRHTHKAEGQLGQDDYDRELSQQGLDEAEKMALQLGSIIKSTDLIVSSPAHRTKQTAEIFAKALNCMFFLTLLITSLGGIAIYFIGLPVFITTKPFFSKDSSTS